MLIVRLAGVLDEIWDLIDSVSEGFQHRDTAHQIQHIYPHIYPTKRKKMCFPCAKVI